MSPRTRDTIARLNAIDNFQYSYVSIDYRPMVCSVLSLPKHPVDAAKGRALEFSRSIIKKMLSVTENMPRSRLVLQWIGLPYKMVSRTVTFIVCFSVPLLLVALVVSGQIQGATNAVLGLLTAGIVTAMGTGFFYLVQRSNRYCRSIELDRATSTLSLQESGFLPWIPRITNVPFHTIQIVRFKVGPEGPNMSLGLFLRCEPADALLEKIDLALPVENLDRRLEALDLVFRIGRILGWDGYVVSRNDPREMDLALNKAGTGENVCEIPLDSAPVDFKSDQPASSFKEPDLQIQPFKPERFRARDGKPQVKWEPGRQVRIFYPPLSLSSIGLRCLTALLAAAFTGFVISIALDLAGPRQWQISVAAGGVSLLLSLINIVPRIVSREVVVDWNTQTALFRRGRREHSVPLQQFREIVLRGKCETRSSNAGKGRRYRTTYWCELVAVLHDSEENISTTDSFLEDPDHPYKMALPMAVELASALNVPWKWEDYPK